MQKPGAQEEQADRIPRPRSAARGCSDSGVHALAIYVSKPTPQSSPTSMVRRLRMLKRCEEHGMCRRRQPKDKADSE
jgi:hypothetical protein